MATTHKTNCEGADAEALLMRIQKLEFIVTIDENDEDMVELKRLVDQYEFLTGVRLS